MDNPDQAVRVKNFIPIKRDNLQAQIIPSRYFSVIALFIAVLDFLIVGIDYITFPADIRGLRS